MAAVLHAVQVPATGGDTLFADMCAAYEGLDDDLKARIDGLTAVHDHLKTFGRQVPPEKQAEIRAMFPPVEHPVVRTHPETGRKMLFVNRFFTDRIVGLDRDQSRDLIDTLCRRADIIEYQCRFRWEPDSVAMWDNRSVQHYACSDYWPSVRVMERASIVGDALLMTYRTTFLLLGKFSDLIRAVRLRAGLRGTHPVRMARATTTALGSLLLYGLDLAQRDYDVMRLRGYSGRMRIHLPHTHSRLADAALVAAGAGALAVSVAWRIGWRTLNPFSWLIPAATLALLALVAAVRIARPARITQEA